MHWVLCTSKIEYMPPPKGSNRVKNTFRGHAHGLQTALSPTSVANWAKKQVFRVHKHTISTQEASHGLESHQLTHTFLFFGDTPNHLSKAPQKCDMLEKMFR